MEANKENDLLVKEAKKARSRAYCVYSGFPVGAALLTDDGTIILGCNVENAAYSVANCAERTAIFSAIAQGKTKFTKIAVSGKTKDFISPCGVCRQALAEFCSQDMEVILANENDEYKIWTVKELLPHAFMLRND